MHLQVDTVKLQSDLEEHLGSEEANWRSATERIEQFSRWSEDLLIRIEHREMIGYPFLIRIRPSLIYLSLLYALTLNFLILSFADSQQGFHSNMFLVLRLMGLFELFLAVLIFVGYILENGRPLHYIQWKNRYQKYFENVYFADSFSISTPSQPNPFRILPKPSILFTFAERHEFIHLILPHILPASLSPQIKFFVFSAFNFISDVKVDGTMYQLLYIIFVVLGIVIHPFFYCFLLLDIIRVSRTLRQLLAAVYKMKNVFFLVIFLMVAAVYILSLYVFVVYPILLQSPATGVSCDYPLQCFLGLLYTAISNAGVIQQFLNVPYFHNIIGYVFGSMFLTLCVYLLLGMIFLNIIFATLVDTFGRIRDTRSEILLDLSNRCFICSIECEIFQRIAAERSAMGREGR